MNYGPLHRHHLRLITAFVRSHAASCPRSLPSMTLVSSVSVFVMPSESETLGFVVLESMASQAMPVVPTSEAVIP